MSALILACISSETGVGVTACFKQSCDQSSELTDLEAVELGAALGLSRCYPLASLDDVQSLHVHSQDRRALSTTVLVSVNCSSSAQVMPHQ